MDTFVINLQKCSIHDGPGIRSTVFFKGCPLKCVWCHNPESQAYSREVLYNEEKCSRCEACIKVCPHGAIYKDDEKVCLNFEKCDQCETCLDYCINNAREIAGTVYTAKELVDELYKDRMFYEESGGGVTLSGGEVMAQDMDYIIDVARRCKGKGFHLAIDTCGFAKTENYENILEYADLFLYDMKLIDNEKHIKFTGKSNELILKNLGFLSNNKANINIRIPLIVGVNVDDDNLEVKKMIEFLKPLNIKAVSLLPYHNIGKHKYSRLYKTYEGEEFEKPSDEKMEEIKDLFEQNNFDTKIGG
ncbi:glycyl-radical enzyme activating protein [Clostridioides mangenotii]|uniref:trans-4-hydroxy-L-proline dehydratase activase n=1 Tax=Metaclostridioides mangenotii TaxID=1540 RepID=UPI002149A77F|nr:trans-4-hydroxy-L-proline dehydratase activase [Clostridioides mangenotii]MCR1953874.1 glycyl-radical enzyme activating protein [Clostridioides mangenotii]